MAYETFDKDLRDGKAREDAFVHVMLRSRVEHKRDKKASRTGNVAIEFECKGSNGEIKPSGIMITEAQIWATEFYPECWILLPTEFVLALLKKARRAKKTQWIGDGNNHHNALIPIEWFVRLPIQRPDINAAEAIANDTGPEFVMGKDYAV